MTLKLGKVTLTSTMTSGQGIAVVDGQIVENLHVVSAQRILAKAQAIREMAAE